MTWLERMTDRFRRGPEQRLHVASDTGEGPVVVMVHGIASSSVTFERLVPLLAPYHRCILIDILGFGASPAPLDAEYTLEEHVAYLHETIKSLDIDERFVLIGHSLGALIAARYANLHENRVSKLVMVGPPIYIAPAAISNKRVRARVSAYLSAYEYIRQNKTFTIRNAAMIAKLLPIKDVFEITEHNWDAFVKSMKNCIESQTVITDIAGLHIPIEVIYGSLDAFMVPGGMEVVERMRHVNVHRVRVNDHLIRNRLARVIARVVD